MKSELNDSEKNYSRLGKLFAKKYLYLFNRKDYISSIRKILAKRQEKYNSEEFSFNKDIFNSTSKFDKNIFDINYENVHNKIIEKQMKKYLNHKDNYKYHSIHINSNSQRKKVQENDHKLYLNPNIITNKNYSFIKSKPYYHSFDKILEKNNNKKNKRNNKNDSKNTIKIKTNSKKIEIIKLKKHHINNNTIKEKIEKNNYKTFNKNDLISHRNIAKIISLKNNFNSIQDSTNLNTLEERKNLSPKMIKNAKVSIKKIHFNNRLKKKASLNYQEKKYLSLDNTRHIRSIDFSKMLSRKKKKNKDIGLSEISNIIGPTTPKYDIIYPKTVIDFIYKEKIPRKNFSPKYRKYDYEFFLDLDKVYNKYNNHKESQSFSIEKISGREKNNQKEIENSKFNNILLSERTTNYNALNRDINNLIKLYINNNLTTKNLNQYGYNTNNDYLENIYKKIISNILDKEKKIIKDARIKKIINGNKINSSYTKLFNIFIEHKFLNYLNSDYY